VRNEIRRINESGLLPPGVFVEEFYSRSDITDAAIDTVFRNAILWMTFATIIQWIFLDDSRGALIAVAAKPFALLLVAMVIVLRHSEALPSVGAMDVGLIVGAMVIAAAIAMRILAGRQKKWSMDCSAGHVDRIDRGKRTSAIIFATARIDRRILGLGAYVVCWSLALFLVFELADAFFSSTRI
jgi:cobalt-zinc-cadmium resistance protein CzcA